MKPFALTRLRADLLLIFVAIVWGTAFVAQKTGLQHMGAATFGAVRFLLSALLVLPLALRERRTTRLSFNTNRLDLALLALSFIAGVLF